jgi:DNA-binding transcriptional ArsR family regulator
MDRAVTLADLDAVQALAQPLRLRILEALREPQSAAAVARALGQPRQNVNYHLKELERAGLVSSAGERRVGNLVERLYQAQAGSFLVSPKVAWSGERRRQALQDQAALSALIDLGETLQRDAAALLDSAAYDGAEVASAAVMAEVSFPDVASRSAFMTEYLELLGPLLARHGAGARLGSPYRVAMAVYPQPEDEAVQ